MSEPVKTSVFISYSRKDRIFALALHERLTLRGLDPFLDQKDIAPGEAWRERLGQLIARADAVVFVVSPSWIDSQICRWEAEEAARLGKRIVPAVWRNPPRGVAVPPQLSRLNYVFFNSASVLDGRRKREKSVDQLVAALETDIGWVREHTRYSELALGWEARGRNPHDLLRGDSLAVAEQWIRNPPPSMSAPTPQLGFFIESSRTQFDREEAEKRANIEKFMVSQSRYLADLATQQVQKGDEVAAILLALEGLPGNMDDPDRPLVSECQSALTNAMLSRRELCAMPAHVGGVNHLVAHPAKHMVLTAGDDGIIRLFDTERLVEIASFHKSNILNLQFVGAGDRVLSVSEDGAAIVWDLATQRVLLSLAGYGHNAQGAKASRDGRMFATVQDGLMLVWGCANNKILGHIRVPERRINCFEFSTDGCYIAIGTGRYSLDPLSDEDTGGYVRVYDISSGTEMAADKAFSLGVTSLSFNPVDGSQLLSTSTAGQATKVCANTCSLPSSGS